MKNESIIKLMERGSKILGSKYSILGGAMAWISEAHLVSTMSNAGIFGVLASGAMNGDMLKKEIELTQGKTSKNFGVNLIMMNPKLHDLIDICGETKISHIILAGGIPDNPLMEKIHSYGIQVLTFAPTLAVAKRLFKYGLDALILEGSEAGGHVGHVSTMILIQDILLNLREYPIFVAGGILRGEVVAALLQLGAVGCQLGTVFACCKESLAHANFKNALLAASGRNAVTPIQLDKKFPVAQVRALENVATVEFIIRQREMLAKFEKGDITLDEGRLSLEYFWAGALRRAVQDGDVEHGSLMSGQIVEIVKDERSIEDIVHLLLAEAESFLAQRIF
ncbi:MAG: nitronate monooxygenase [Holosporaceae bacterium]|jgi:enoyl-[acyl-carrier protein] reductase II|nr:nitronate monooxygenase [Holosporaceae bacterium]